MTCQPVHDAASTTHGRRAKVLLVIDRPNWAFGFIAERVARDISDEFDVAIVATESLTRAAFFREIQRVNPDVVHFFWRKELSDILNALSDDVRYAKRRDVIVNRRITFSVPDHLYSALSDIMDLGLIFSVASGYIVTSTKLFEQYRRHQIIPKPCAIIHDLYVPSNWCVRREKGRALRIVWIGNSKWGQWIGQIDHKGVKSIIDPLFDRLNGIYKDRIELIRVDSAVRHVIKSEVMSLLRESDILICASESEGTPLPLLEAMEVGCAVVTTDVGIAEEILPKVQRPYIVERTVDAFLQAVVRLADDRLALEEIQAANRAAFVALDLAGVGAKWRSFFRGALKSELRADLMAARFSLNPHLRGLAPFLSRFTRSKKVLRTLSRISAPNCREITAKAARVIEDNMLRASTTLIKNKHEALFIVNPRWPGVLHSTLTLAGGACLPYPRQRWRDADTIPDEELSLIAERIASVKPRQIVLSGGERYQVRLAHRLRSVAPQTEISVIWHGQLAQWASDYEREVFMEWLDAYSGGVITKIGVMKQSLDELLSKRGVRAFRLSNFVANWTLSPPSPIRDTGTLGLGLWTASGEYRKNIFTQIMSVIMCDDDVTLHHCFGERQVIDAFARFKISNKRWGQGHLNSNMLSFAMAQTHLTLYVTLGECSPMIPLESMAAGSPALVGPVSDVYDCDATLRGILTVDKPETPSAIAAAIKLASDARGTLLERRDDFLIASRDLGIARLDRFLAS